jgi:hypothetical protein
LADRLQYLQAISGDRLACLPLELRLRGKSTRQSHGSPIFYVDITVRSGLSIEAALQHARETNEVRQASGFDQQALDFAARLGFANGSFEDSEEEGDAIVEEFFPAPSAATTKTPAPAGEPISASPPRYQRCCAHALKHAISSPTISKRRCQAAAQRQLNA